MMKKYSILVFILLVIIVVVNMGYDFREKTPEEKPEFEKLTGIIKEIHIDYFKGESGEFEKAYPNYFLMESNDEYYIIYYSNNSNYRVGQNVEIKYDSVLTSKPAQIIPLAIEILD